MFNKLFLQVFLLVNETCIMSRAHTPDFCNQVSQSNVHIRTPSSTLEETTVYKALCIRAALRNAWL